MRKMVLLFCLFGALLPASAQASSAGELLSKIPVRAEQNNGYDRDLFDHWLDSDRNGCDARDEVLLRQNLASRPTCGARIGRWYSAYDGLIFTESSRLDIDHFVPLAEAWGSGAWRWKADTRDSYANDLYGYSLLAVSASSNRSKSDRDPGEWLPPKSSYRCSYLARWVAVKYRWRLAIDQNEKAALRRGMSRCASRSLQVSKIARARIEVSNVAPPPGPGDGLDPRFSSCTEARAAGYGPYYRDRDPEYAWYRDGDGDGVVCE